MNPLGRKGAAAAASAWMALNRRAFRDRIASARPRLLVDVSVIARHDAATGIQRVVRAVWLGLNALEERPWEVVPVCAGSTHGYRYADPHFLERPGRPLGGPVGVRPGDRFLGLDLAAHYLPLCAPQLRAWRAAGASAHFVVYDLLPLERPEWFNPRSVEHFSRWFATVLDHADQLLCISDDVRRNLQQRLAAVGRQIPVDRLHLSGDLASSRPSAGISVSAAAALDRMSERPTVLMVGTVEPRKGHAAALSAFEHLWRQHSAAAPDLVIVGKPGWKTGDLQDRLHSHPERGTRLNWVEDASDEALSAFYDRCSGLLFPSYAEGFGLPLAEAARHGRWVLARDLPVYREFGFNNLLVFDDDAPERLGARILDLLAAARREPPPCTAPGWDWCADQLLRQIGSCPTMPDTPPAALRFS